jgi:methyltransferase
VVWYVLLIVAVAMERLAELIFSTRNLASSRARGRVESGADRDGTPIICLGLELGA